MQHYRKPNSSNYWTKSAMSLKSPTWPLGSILRGGEGMKPAKQLNVSHPEAVSDQGGTPVRNRLSLANRARLRHAARRPCRRLFFNISFHIQRTKHVDPSCNSDGHGDRKSYGGTHLLILRWWMGYLALMSHSAWRNYSIYRQIYLLDS